MLETLAQEARYGIRQLNQSPKFLTSLSWTPPVLVGTRLFLRDRKTMLSVGH